MRTILVIVILYFFFCIVSVSAQEKIFCKTIRGPSTNTTFITFAPTADRGSIVLGCVIDPFFSPSSSALFISKLDSNAQVQWSKSVGPPDGIFEGGIIQTSDGGYVCTASGTVGDRNVVVIKFDSSGTEQWIKVIGAAGNDYGQSILQTLDGGYLIAGGTESYGSGYFDMYLIKLDASGNISFSTTVGTTFSDHAYSMIKTDDGGYLVGGSSPFGDMFVVKLNSLLNVQWSRNVGTSFFDRVNSMVQADDGGYVLTGWGAASGFGNYYVVKLNASGIPQWTYRYAAVGGEATPTSVIKTGNGGYLITGRARNASGRYDCLALKITATGQQEWGKILGPSEFNPFLTASAFLTADHHYLIGTSQHEIINSTLYSQLLIMKIDSAGNSCCEVSSYGSRDTVVSSTSDSVMTVTNILSPITSYGSFHFFNTTDTVFCGYNAVSESNSLSKNIFLYPNPAGEEMNIKFPSHSHSASTGTLRISDVKGRKILEEKINVASFRDKELKIDIKNFHPGIYIVSIASGEINRIAKLVKQ